MKNRTLWIAGAVLLGLALLFSLTFWPEGERSPDTSAFDAATARFDSLADHYQARHAEALARADSLQAVVAAKDTALDEAAVRTARAEAGHAEAARRVRDFAEAGVGVGKDEFDLQAYVALRDARSVTDSLIAGLRDQVQLLGEQNDALKAQNELLRAQLAGQDSVVAQARRAVETAHQANETLRQALRREERGRKLWRGATYASAGAAAALGIICAAKC